MCYKNDPEISVPQKKSERLVLKMRILFSKYFFLNVEPYEPSLCTKISVQKLFR